MSSQVRTYTAKERNMYLVGMMGQNMIYNIIGTGLYFYFQSVIFIPAMAISIFMAVARVWDAINDPMMGTFVDRTNTKWGKCRPYLLFSPAVIMVITILTFCNGMYSSANTPGKNALIVGWAAVSYILWGMCYTVGDIPLWGVTSRMTEVEKDRASILSFARIADHQSTVSGAGEKVGVRCRFCTEGPANGLYHRGSDLNGNRLWYVPDDRCFCAGACALCGAKVRV